MINGHDSINFSIGVSLPIWRDKINGGVREAAHQRNSTIHLREAERDRLGGQLRRQVAAAYAATEQLGLFRDRLIPKTEQTLEIATADYQGRLHRSHRNIPRTAELPSSSGSGNACQYYGPN
ncbi:MAG: TolC family protein [Aureliella sp.]